MKAIARLLFISIVLLVNLDASGQDVYNIAGTVSDDKGITQPGASVFISGTKLMTATDADGKFTFGKLAAGTYQVSVKMLGFDVYAKPVVIKDEPIKVDIVLKVKATDLAEVVINPVQRSKYLELFRSNFIGIDPVRCRLINPEVLSFTFDKESKMLRADASELLIILNKYLGYRIRYLLKYFIYDEKDHMVTYNGETVFEELDGTDAEKQQWTQNRAATYKYSMMHFMRAIHTGDLRKEGFWVRKVNAVTRNSFSNNLLIYAEPAPVDLKDYVTVVDSSFVSLRFDKWYVLHFDPVKANAPALTKDDMKGKVSNATNNGTFMQFIAKDVLIDRRGSYTVFKTFVLEGGMGGKRVSDQLPFEYWP